MREFDQLLDVSRQDAYQSAGYGGQPETVDGQRPLCGELIAWRHPSFGNYTNGLLCDSFVRAHNYDYMRGSFSTFECLSWLLSDDSYWLPPALKGALTDGMNHISYGWSHDLYLRDFSNLFVASLTRLPRSKFNLTKRLRSSLEELFSKALIELKINIGANLIAERFLAQGFIEGYYDEKDRFALLRREPNRRDSN